MEEILIAALRASLGSPGALSLLARIEFLLAEGSCGCATRELDELIDKWATEIIDVDPCEVGRLKRGLSSVAIGQEHRASADSGASVRVLRR